MNIAHPIFFWNGIKDDKKSKLQRAHYSAGQYRNFPEGTITVYARDYTSFSAKVAEHFSVRNNSDMMVDYAEKDRFRVTPNHPLYGKVKEAMDAMTEHNRRQTGKRKAMEAKASR